MKERFLYLLKIVCPLTVICLLMVALIAVVNHFTAPAIEQNEKALFDESIKKLFALSEDASPEVKAMPLPEGDALPKGAVAAYAVGIEGELLGYCMEVRGSGAYSEDLRMLVALDDQGRIIDLSCLAQSETPGKGDKVLNGSFYAAHYVGKDARQSVSAETPFVSGSTRTSTALYNAVSCAADLYEILVRQEGGETT